MSTSKNLIACVGGVVLACAASAFSAGPMIGPDEGGPGDPQEVLGRFLAEHPGSGIFEAGGLPTRVYGKAFSHGATPQASAAAFLDEYAGMFGLGPDELMAAGPLADGRHVQPIMYDQQTGQYKFTGLYYTQVRGDIPVFRSRLTLLVRNEGGYPLVLASANIRELGAFEPQAAGAALRPGRAIAGALKAVAGLRDFTRPELVIWAGVGDLPAEPALAYRFIGERGGPADGEGHEKYLFIADAADGGILYLEDMIITEDVVGNVQGRATEGKAADFCEEEVPVPMSYARVNIGGTVAWADENGDFVIPNAGNDPVTVQSAVRGKWFRVFNYAGPDTVLQQEVTPPGPADFMHNDANNSEYIRAEVNGYVQANIVRDFTLVYNPAYPGLQQNEFPVNVNINDNCNAYYDYNSINFFTSGGGCANTAFSTVVHHEYGHHLVYLAGSGQGQYGEGMADTMGVLILDDPGLAYGFYGDCDEVMRTADNTMQYPCYGEIHYCGQLLSGCVWSTRNELIVNYPTDYLDIISNLAVNAMLLHTGDSITPQITIDYLTLDDDDENIYNGTPHYDEINAGFSAHNMPGPEVLTGLEVSPEEGLAAEGANGGPFVPDSITYTLYNYDDYPLEYTVSKTAEWFDLSDEGGTIPAEGSVEVIVSLNDLPDDYPNGHYEDVVEFVNTTNHDGDTTRLITLDVGVPVPVYTFSMDEDPGWSMNGQWAFGHPTGQGGASHGYPDPTGGATGSNVCGVNLNGDYSTTPGGPYTLTTGPIDCSQLSQVQLHFQRWLNTDYQPYVFARIHVSVNGTNWVTIWENGSSEIADNAWSEQEFDIASIADNEPTLYVRWDYQITSGAWAYSGWNIDDVAIWGVEPTPECPEDINGDGVVNTEDLLLLLGNWGGTGDGDIDDNGTVNTADLLLLLAAWGDCP